MEDRRLLPAQRQLAVDLRPSRLHLLRSEPFVLTPAIAGKTGERRVVSLRRRACSFALARRQQRLRIEEGLEPARGSRDRVISPLDGILGSWEL